jgi:hypothetical protein
MAFDWSSITGNKAFMRAAGEGLQDLSYGLARSPTIGGAFGEATMRGQDMQQTRDLANKQRGEEAKRLDQINKTAEYLRSKGYDDLLAGVESGGMDMGSAWTEALRRGQPGYGAPELTADMQNYQFAQANPGFSDFLNPGVAQPNAPSGYQWNPDGSQSFVPGGPADPAFAGSKPPTDAQRRAASLYTVVAPDAELLLGNGTAANPGIYDALGDGGSQAWNGIGVAGINPLAPLASADFQTAKDAVTSIAQSYLYATSGAAAPAEEVKKIADLVTPNPGDSPDRKAQKRARLQTYIDAIKSSTIPAPMTNNSGGDWEVIGVQ